MKNTIQTKRSKQSPSGFRALYAKTKTGGKQRKVRAATATMDSHADLESDIPNVGIGRALLVILLLHVVAIGAFYVHTSYFGNQTTAEETQAPKKQNVKPAAPAAAIVNTPEVVAPVAVAPAAQVERLSQRYIVTTGDSYSRIAQVRNVDEIALRALNNDRPLRAGVVLDLPAQLSTRPVAVANNEVAPEKPAAVFIKPMKVYPRAVIVEEETTYSAITPMTVKDSGQRYTVESGDTLWRISKRYGVTSEQLLILNGIEDANKLKVGLTLLIPTQ